MATSTDPKPTDFAQARIRVRDFVGLMGATDPHDIPPGAAVVQVNTVPIRPGELRVRAGFRVVKFDS